MEEKMDGREKFIRMKLRDHYDEAKSLGHEVFCLVLQGSQNYDLDIYCDAYKSDVDTKAILLPSFDSFCRGSLPISTTHVRANNEHIDLKDIRTMFETFRKQNINFVEVLFSRFYIVPEKYRETWEKLQQMGEKLTHCHPSQTLKTMAGLSFEKHKALCHPYPSIIDKINQYGYDGKQLHHIIRINMFIKKYLSGVPFAECLTSRTNEEYAMLIRAKMNGYSLIEAKEIADALNAENNAMKDDYIAKHGADIVDVQPYIELDSIKVDVLRSWFKEQLQ